MRFRLNLKHDLPRRGSLEVDEIFFDQHQLNARDLRWENRLEKALPPAHIKILRYLAGAIFVVILAKVFYVSGLRSRFYEARAKANYIKEVWELSPRGIIYDFKHQPLVKNVSTFNLVAVPGELPRDRAGQEHIIEILGQYLNKSSLEIQEQFEKIDRFSFKPVPILGDLNHEEILALKSQIQDLPGLKLEESFKRDYGSPALSHILGYTGRASPDDIKKNPDYLLTDVVGKSALEAEYENILRCQHGLTLVETRAQGGPGQVAGQTVAEPGRNLNLFLDADLQTKLTEVMSRTLNSLGLTGGAAVAIDPTSGGVLALQSFPLFDGNIFSSRLSEEDYQKLFNSTARPLFNRAMAGLYPPGSTIKPFIGVAALQEKVITAQTKINDVGGITVAGQEFKGWKALGIVDIYKAIALSSNPFFYTVGGGYGNIGGLGPERIASYLKKFGFTVPTHIDLPGEAAGFIPSPDWKREFKHEGWFIGDTYNMSIGQGYVQVTPLELALATAAIANNGTLIKPRVVKSITDSSGKIVKNIEPEIIGRNFADPEALNIIRKAMHDTVLSGSGRALANLPGSAGAKTGTAQTGIGRNTHAWFTVFAPFENPKIALTILIENGGEGSAVAVPIAQEVLEWYLTR